MRSSSPSRRLNGRVRLPEYAVQVSLKEADRRKQHRALISEKHRVLFQRIHTQLKFSKIPAVLLLFQIPDEQVPELGRIEFVLIVQLYDIYLLDHFCF